MTRLLLRAPRRAALLVLALAACEDAEGVSVQPLPSLERPSAERRAGLPEVAGTWRFAGWELPVRDTATAGEGMLPPGALTVHTQRLDSVAGDYLRDAQRFPFVGEVRRDGILSVVAFGPDGSGSFIAGRVVKDTLWVELTSLSAAETWSAGARAAMVRTPVARPFVRYQGGFVPVNVDSIRADSVRRDSLRLADSLRMADSARLAPVPPAPVPGQPQTQPQVQPQVQQPPPAVPPAQQPRTQPAPKQPEPKQAQPKQPPAKQRPPRTEDTAKQRETPERRPARPRDTVRLPDPEPEEQPARPDTAARPRQVIIP